VATVIESRLSELLGRRRMEIKEFATGAGISYGAAWKLYHDRTTTYDRELLAKACRFLGVDLCELLVYTPAAAPEGEPDGAGELAGAKG
jgi:putative transcriptional regulator